MVDGLFQGEKGIVGLFGDMGEKGIKGNMGAKVRKRGREPMAYIYLRQRVHTGGKSYKGSILRVYGLCTAH